MNKQEKLDFSLARDSWMRGRVDPVAADLRPLAEFTLPTVTRPLDSPQQ